MSLKVGLVIMLLGLAWYTFMPSQTMPSQTDYHLGLLVASGGAFLLLGWQD